MTTRTAHVAVYDGLADWEVGYLMVELRTGRYLDTPWTVLTTAISAEPITSMGGLRIVPDLTFADVSPQHSDLLVLPGGDGWADFAGSDDLLDLARQFLAADVPVAAICGATEALARAGMLDDRRHTSGALEALSYQPGYHGADLYVDERAVTDRGLITAGPQSPTQFARATLSYLGVASEETLDAWEDVFYRGDPAGYGRLMQARSGGTGG